VEASPIAVGIFRGVLNRNPYLGPASTVNVDFLDDVDHRGEVDIEILDRLLHRNPPLLHVDVQAHPLSMVHIAPNLY